MTRAGTVPPRGAGDGLGPPPSRTQCHLPGCADPGQNPLVFAGALDGVIFVQWLRDRLLPTLVPGTTIVLDNLSAHRETAAITAKGCQLRFLPASSTNLNLTELKTHLRRSTSREDELPLTTIGEDFDRITSRDAVTRSRQCGYHLTLSHPGQPL